jgi:hypothetical protein
MANSLVDSLFNDFMKLPYVQRSMKYGSDPWVMYKQFWLLILLVWVLLIPFGSLALVKVLFILFPIWGPIVMWDQLKKWWMKYINMVFISSQEHILLEIKIPREITKSPRAMEMVMPLFDQGSGESNEIFLYWDGKVRPWFSLEFASDGGQVSMYIWMRKNFKDLVESHIYAQFPEVEIFQVEDYTKNIDFNKSKMTLQALEFKKAKSDVYPIKSYIDYELEKNPDEEFKIDPIAHVFEVLSTCKPGQKMWAQIIVRKDKNDHREWEIEVDGGDKEVRHGVWAKQSADEVKIIREKATGTYYEEVEDKDGVKKKVKRRGFPNPTPGDTDAIKLIERHMVKTPLEVGMRGIFIQEHGVRGGAGWLGLVNLFKQYAGPANSLIPSGYHTIFNYPWQGKYGLSEIFSEEALMMYKMRSFFNYPHGEPGFVMTVEELASLWHFPSEAVRAPGISRIPSAKAEAPPNLPIA